MSRKLERISIFDDCEYTTESSVMDTLTQSAGANCLLKTLSHLMLNWENQNFSERNLGIILGSLVL